MGMAATPQISNFWISSFPYFSSTLVSTFAGLPAETEHKLNFFDADGELINEASSVFPAGQSNFGQCNFLELDPFLESCKLEGGLKHGRLQIISPQGSRHMLRLHGRHNACLSSSTLRVSGSQSSFFPMALSRDRSFLVAAVNESDVEGVLRVRLFAGTRAPETTCLIPPRGARIISIPAEFPSHIPDGPGAQQAYLRLGTTSDAILGAQLIERNDSATDRETYSSLS